MSTYVNHQLVAALGAREGAEGQPVLADIDGNGQPDLVVFHVDNPGGENHGYYRLITACSRSRGGSRTWLAAARDRHRRTVRR